MFRREWISPVVLLAVVGIFATDFADALPRRRRRQSNNYSYGTSYGETGFLQVAPKVDVESYSYRDLAVNYSYERASRQEVAFSDKVRVFVDVWDNELLSSTEPIVAEVKITDLSNSQQSRVKYVPVSITQNLGEYRTAEFEIQNAAGEPALLQAAKVYRLFVNLHRQADEYGAESAFGSVPVPYYVATSGDSRLDRARQQIVMRTFREFYYTERGWNSGENYPMDCYAYYMWATGICTVGAYNNWTNLGSLFNGSIPFHSGGQIPELAAVDPIHGDYVRQPGHSFMLLAYDPQLQQLWTMEANFNHTIEVVNRYVGAGWSVGHLVPEHIRPGLYLTSSASEVGGDGE